MRKIINGVALVSLLLSFSCSSSEVKQKVDPNLFYKRDMDINVNGAKATGILVAKESKEYKIIIRSSGELDLLTIETCHRSESFEKAGRDEEVEVRKWFRKKKKIKKNSKSFEYIYKPASGIEDTGSCPLFIGGYDERGRHSWGSMEFESSEWTLPGNLRCNGTSHKANGVSMCQSKAGLIQLITFDKAVQISPDPQCPILRRSDKRFEITMPVGRCAYVFKEGDKFHRLITIGYQNILLRKVLE